MVDFSSVLNRKPVEVERPKPLPAGTYHVMVEKHEFLESKEKKTPYLHILFKILGPGPDVDPASLVGVDYAKRQLRQDFFLTEDALWRLREFFEKAIGIDIGQRTFGEIIANELPTKQVMAMVVQVPSQKAGDDSIYNNISGFAKIN